MKDFLKFGTLLTKGEAKNIRGGNQECLNMGCTVTNQGCDCGNGLILVSLKCHNIETSCWKDRCPKDLTEAQKWCLEAECGGSYSSISWAV